MKVTDLEAGEDSKSSKDPPKRQSVFDRLAYGGTKSSTSKKIGDESSEISKTGRLAGRNSKEKINPVKPKVVVSNPDGQPTSSSSSGSVFDRLTSGERLYRTTTQSGRKPAGRRADPVESKVAVNKKTNPSNDVTAVIPETMEETVNGSPERDLDDFNEEDDPVIHISLIQPPVKVRSARPVKKSARLSAEKEQKRRRKSWVIY